MSGYDSVNGIIMNRFQLASVIVTYLLHMFGHFLLVDLEIRGNYFLPFPAAFLHAALYSLSTIYLVPFLLRPFLRSSPPLSLSRSVPKFIQLGKYWEIPGVAVS